MILRRWPGSQPVHLLSFRGIQPAKNLRELLAWLKANPEKATQGTAGAGSPQHIAGIYFQKETATRFQFVPYRGVAPAMQDLLALGNNRRRCPPIKHYRCCILGKAPAKTLEHS